jgi:hypothetical protein
MKTIREQLQDLPDGYRELALANANAANLDKHATSLGTA